MTNLDDTSLVPHLNLQYHELEDWAVSNYRDDLFWNEKKTDTIEDQYKYQLDWTFKKLQEVKILWKSDDTYYDVLSRIESDYVAWWDDQQAEGGRKFYDIQWDYLCIFPSPKESVTDWVIVKSIVNLVDITSTSLSADIYPSCRFAVQLQGLLMYRMRVVMYMLKGEQQNQQVALQESQIKEWEVLKMMRGLETEQNTIGVRPLDNYYMS